MDLTKLPVIELNLVGLDGNAFAVMGEVKRAARKAGWPKEAQDALMQEMMAGDYDHLLATALKYTTLPEEV